MAQCVKFPNLEGKTTILPGNFETCLSDKGRNLWMKFIRDIPQWNRYRRAEQKFLAVQYRQTGNNTDLSESLATQEVYFRKAEEEMFDIASKWTSVPE